MKKSRSFKLSMEVPQPGKPPPLNVPAIDQTTSSKRSLKKSMETLVETSPNYMKSTSSSDAKKEHNQVSSKTYPFVSDKSLRRKNSEQDSVSVQKPMQTLVQTSNLKLMRNFKKTPSFKPSRPCARKCSHVSKCEDLKVEKSATCSSTLKNSKFPDYLELNPGATESKGTSAMKVCPYNYCSLNDQHHDLPLPPLRTFLSTKRRVLKSQKRIKLRCQSPPHKKRPPLKDGIRDCDTSMILENKLLTDQSPYFFIEIYTKESKLDADTITSSKHQGDDHDIIGFGVMPRAGWDEKVTQSLENQEVESITDEPPFSDIDFEDNVDQHGCFVSTKTDIINYFLEDQKLKDSEEDIIMRCISDQDDLNIGSELSVQQEGLDSKDSDMEWEEGEFFTLYLADGDGDDDEANYLEVEVHPSQDEPFLMLNSMSNCSEGIFVDEEKQENHPDEEIESYNIQIVNTGSVSYGSYNQYLDSKSINVPKDLSPDKISLMHDMFEKEPMTIKDKDGDFEYDGAITLVNSFLEVYPSEEQIAAIDNERNRLNQPNDEVPGKSSIDQIDATKSMVEPALENSGVEDHQESELKVITKDIKADGNVANEGHQAENQIESQGKKSLVCAVNLSSQEETKSFRPSNSIDPKGQDHMVMTVLSLAESTLERVTSPKAKDSPFKETKATCFDAKMDSNQEFIRTGKSSKWKSRAKRLVEEELELRKFNPQEPNYIPMQPEPEAERVYLRHQMIDERKNSEEWMLDYALRQAVNKLEPARKKKVALLVEAFESVIPVPKFETRLRHTPTMFSNTRIIQACS